MAAQDAQNEQLRKAVEQALAASFVARRAKADVAKDLLNKDRPPTADDIRQALEDGGWAKELRAISASRRVEAPSLHYYESSPGMMAVAVFFIEFDRDAPRRQKRHCC